MPPGLEDRRDDELRWGPLAASLWRGRWRCTLDMLLAHEPNAKQTPALRDLVPTRLLKVADRGGILLLATTTDFATRLHTGWRAPPAEMVDQRLTHLTQSSGMPAGGCAVAVRFARSTTTHAS